MKRKFIVFLSVFMFLSVFSLSYGGVGSAASVGYCEMTISKDNLGYENGVTPNNYCATEIVGYYGAGYYHISGAVTDVVTYSGQKFQFTNPFSPNAYEILTVYIEGEDGSVDRPATRISGSTRLDTAIEVSKQGWPAGLTNSEKSVVIARADNPADALAASSLAGVKDAPILLTYSNDLSQSVLNELNRLNAEKVYLLGGEVAINENVRMDLRQRGFDVERVSGATRFETAARINEVAGTSASTRAIIANGYSVADALSASADAAINEVPIYLTKEDEMPVDLPSNITSVDIYGGTAVISEQVSNQLKAKGITVNRISGHNRYTTSIAGAENLAGANSNIILVRGQSVKTTKQDFPDAVAASSLAKQMNAKVLLVHPTIFVQETKNYLEGKNLNVYVLGGEGAIPSAMLSKLGVDATQ